ncbi:MAG: GFA family protein [Halioglobus sp.]
MCHCSQCRQAQGGLFATNSPIDAEKLHISGGQYIKEFESNKNKVRAFCSNCGSPLYSARKDLHNIKRLRLGSVKTPFVCENRYHIFSSSTASWEVISDNYPQFDEHKN